MPQTDTVVTFRFQDRDVTLRKADNCVDHIGYRIFPHDARSASIHPLVADFVERYWLQLTLPGKRQRSVKRQMAEDEFRFLIGDLQSISRIQRDTTLTLTSFITESIATITWTKNHKTVCAISFPINHELILGRNMLENDRRLPQEVAATNVGRNAVMPLDAGTYIVEELKSERYLEGSKPIFNTDKTLQSIANLLTGYDMPQADSIRLDITHRIYGPAEQKWQTSIRQFVGFAMQNGCRPYVGILAADSLNADVLVVFHNQPLGYNHIMRVAIPIECIAKGKGTASARLNAYVPASNIKNLL